MVAGIVAGRAHPVAAAGRAPLAGGVGAEEPADAPVRAARGRLDFAGAGERAERVAGQPGERHVNRVGVRSGELLVPPRAGVIPGQRRD